MILAGLVSNYFSRIAGMKDPFRMSHLAIFVSLQPFIIFLRIKYQILSWPV